MLSFIGSYTNLRGGDSLSDLIRKMEPKPLRVFLQDGTNDQNIYSRQLVHGEPGHGAVAGIRGLRHEVRRRNRGAQLATRLGDPARRAALALAGLPQADRNVPSKAGNAHYIREILDPAHDWEEVGARLSSRRKVRRWIGTATSTSATPAHRSIYRIGADGR